MLATFHRDVLDEILGLIESVSEGYRAYSHGGESRDLNDRVHGISCRYSDKTSEQTDHTFLNTQPIFIKQSAHTS